MVLIPASRHVEKCEACKNEREGEVEVEIKVEAM